MARHKSKRLTDVAVAIKRAVEDVPEIGGTNFQVGEGGIITFNSFDGKTCRIKFSIENGPRKNKEDTVLDNLI